MKSTRKYPAPRNVYKFPVTVWLNKREKEALELIAQYFHQPMAYIVREAYKQFMRQHLHIIISMKKRGK